MFGLWWGQSRDVNNVPCNLLKNGKRSKGGLLVSQEKERRGTDSDMRHASDRLGRSET